MKRFHVHVAVYDLEQSIRFCSALFGDEPSVKKDDYAKWMLEDPRINFAIANRSDKAGVNHLGLQAVNGAELEDIGATSKPILSIAAPTSACASARVNSPLRRAMISLGVAAEASTAYQPPTSKPGNPVSLSVGISGWARRRFGDEKPRSFSLPACA